LAERLLQEGKAKEGWQAVSKYKSDRLTEVQQGLLKRIDDLVVAKNSLAALVRETKANGVIEPHKVVSLLPEVLKYLKINPRHTVVKSLYQDLCDRFGRFSAGQLLAVPVAENSLGMRLKLLPPGKFRMGDPKGDSDETPHEVTLTNALYTGVHQVTQEEYKRVMGTNPSKFKGAKNPVEMVSWEDAVEFCKRLSAMQEEKAAGRAYRLPTEAEWE
jgi:formylglycine-generating enzyme required for sulfatase activity